MRSKDSLTFSLNWSISYLIFFQLWMLLFLLLRNQPILLLLQEIWIHLTLVSCHFSLVLFLFSILSSEYVLISVFFFLIELRKKFQFSFRVTLTHCLAITQSRQEDVAIVHGVFSSRRKVKKEICKKQNKTKPKNKKQLLKVEYYCKVCSFKKNYWITTI